MPKMDVFELYHKIKKKDTNNNICFLTASELYYEQFRKKEYYALDKSIFIRKPIDNEIASKRTKQNDQKIKPIIS
jgi:CheY-like chemotaxis protein